MLIDFSIKNYASIKDKMTLSAETGEHLSRLKGSNTLIENHISLLKSLVIIGPNGSGKSSLIDGLHLMKSMVLNNPTRITDQLRYRPFILSEGSQDNAIGFQIKFNYSGNTYEYSFTFLQDKIVTEELKLIKKTTEQIYFSRQDQDYPILPDNLKTIALNTKQNSLLLYNAQQANDPQAIAVMRWFQDDLIFVDDTQIPDQLVNLMKRQDIKSEFLRFLQFADFNITDVTVREVPVPTFPDDLRKILDIINPNAEIPTSSQQLSAVHKKFNQTGDVVGTQEIPLSMESRGTQKVFLIALSIINAQLNGNGKTLLFDEFDDSLHFELSKALIQIFNSKQNKNQFILTTHELQLLDANLRTDQIYLMEKDFQGRSDLKSIFDFKDPKEKRHDIRYMRRYIEGRFGALPQIQVDEMLSALNAPGSEVK
ncbi:AAA family ATPase [Lapidilactobacillus gannanensis]|jgi:AAA15 family ATPase/GTPase|uniref:ATP/GTP-binding protein n=2 Tax=Lapidilactobacillus TaxID=2767884 RepID=A0ABW4BP98_9LACO|nr:ATP-binding protein [Lapidilactobacillus gannanensis]MCH4056717.1 AAA family ATPase [Lactobacillaceae bacterium]